MGVIGSILGAMVGALLGLFIDFLLILTVLSGMAIADRIFLDVAIIGFTILMSAIIGGIKIKA